MKDLLRADIFRIRKNKLFLISLILAAAFPLMTVSLYYGINKLALIDLSDMPQELGDMNLFSLQTVLASVFSLSNNLGLIIPIFSCLFVNMDISSGTLRNKIIVGKTRNKIYLSHLIASIGYNLLIISVYFLFTLIFGLIFFGTTELKALSVTCFVITGELTFAFVACLSTFFILVTKAAAPSIIFTELIAIGISLLCSLLPFVNYEKVKYLVYLIPMFSNSQSTFGSSVMPAAMFWEGIASYAIFGTALTLVGMLLFRKKDLK